MTRIYRSQAELRDLLVDQGVQLLVDEGFQPGNLTLARVFERVERAGLPRVTKGSVLGTDRIWPTQKEFQLDVEVEVVHRWADSESELPPTLSAAAEVLQAANLSTAQGRQAAVRQLCRVAGRANFEANRASRLWKLMIALWGREASNPETDKDHRVAEAISVAAQQVTLQIIDEIYRPLVEIVGYRGRPEFGSTENALRLLAVSGYALNDGFILRDEFTASSGNLVLATGTDGHAEPWTEFSIGLEALVNRFLEPTCTDV